MTEQFEEYRIIPLITVVFVNLNWHIQAQLESARYDQLRSKRARFNIVSVFTKFQLAQTED